MTQAMDTGFAANPTSDAAARRSWAWALSGLALGSGSLLLLFHDALGRMFGTWWTSPSFEHGLLVPLVAALVIWLDRQALARMVPRPWPLGLLLAVLAAFAAALGGAASALVAQQLALVFSLQAMTAAVLGPEVTRRIAFPLAFLVFAVPFGDVMVPALRDLTAEATAEILRRAGWTATIDGFLIRLPSADYRIAEACAGLRFLLVGLAIGLLAAKLFLRSWQRWALLVLLAITVPIAANIVRTVLMIVLAESEVLRPESVWAHLTYGMGFNAVIITILLLLVFALREAPAVPAKAQPRPQQSGRLVFPFIAIVAAAVPAFGLTLGEHRSEPPAIAANLAPALPGAGWRAAATADDGWRPRAVGADAELVRSFAKDDQHVDLYIGYFLYQRQGGEVVSDANRLGAMGRWRDVGRLPLRLRIGEATLSADAVITQADHQRRLSFHCFWVDGDFTASAIGAKWRQAAATLFAGDPAAAAVVVSIAYRDDPALAAATLQDFVAALRLFPTAGTD